MDFDGIKALLVILVVIAGSLGLAYVLVSHDEKVWAEYSRQHHCRVTGYVAGTVGTGIATGGNGGVAVVVIPEKHIYTCDGGYTVER